jgi:hypothetical protein
LLSFLESAMFFHSVIQFLATVKKFHVFLLLHWSQVFETLKMN